MIKISQTPLDEEIKCALNRLNRIAIRTPLVENERLNTILGGRLLIKAECLQLTGSFKYRGAFNCISNLSRTDQAAGVICYSSGNHAQAVAATANHLGMDAVVVVPSTAPSVKINVARKYGAEVLVHEGDRASMELFVQKLATKTGRFLVKPFDDPHIIAGQATVGVEIAEELVERNIKATSILVPCSGGGLTAGIALALETRMPETSVHPVEPRNFDDTARSLKSGRVVSNSHESGSICDALLVPKPGELTFAINKVRVGIGYMVSDDAVREAMKVAFEYFKIILEPSGAIALAAVMSKQIDLRNKAVVVIGSGGNADPVMFSQILAQG